jgi:hypothetical protein
MLPKTHDHSLRKQEVDLIILPLFSSIHSPLCPGYTGSYCVSSRNVQSLFRQPKEVGSTTMYKDQISQELNGTKALYLSLNGTNNPPAFLENQ